MPHYHRFLSKRRINKMNRRQQKKFYAGGFQNLIFGVCGSLFPNGCLETFAGELLDFIEPQAICMAGSYSNGGFSFVFDHCERPPHNITPEQRQMIIDWLAARKDVEHLRAGGLIDGFYSSEAQYGRYDEICK